MQFSIRRPWQLHQSRHTPPEVYAARKQHRREFLQTIGLGAAAGLAGSLSGCGGPTEEELRAAGAVEPLPADQAGAYPAKRNEAFTYGRPETPRREAAIWTNFYEFTGPYTKKSYLYVDKFQPTPWQVEVGGLCGKPRTFDLDDIYSEFNLEERAYRHRCVETWAMCCPWTGFPLRELLKAVDPKPFAKYVAFETFNRPAEAEYIARDPSYPWPYTEGLTIDEAKNELTLLATGIYGEPLPKQHGAPVRLVVPWKYGFKSIKSIVKITLLEKRPASFWNSVQPREYGFEANVNPDVPHPRWSQRTERMLGSNERHDTVIYNGYGDYVAGLYT